MNTGLILGCVKVQSVKDGDNLLLISSLESDRCRRIHNTRLHRRSACGDLTQWFVRCPLQALSLMFRPLTFC